MNTKQLILFWYVGIALILAIPATIPYTKFSDLIISVLAILILALLLYLTFKGSENINRKIVVYSAILPIGVVFLSALSLDILKNNNVFTTQIPVDEIEVFDLKFEIRDSPLGKQAILSGRVQNNSEYELNNLVLNIKIQSIEKELYVKEIGDLSFSRIIDHVYIDEVPDSLKKSLDRVIDSETFEWISNVEPESTKSFKIESYPSSLNPTDHWVWSYEIVSALQN